MSTPSHLLILRADADPKIGTGHVMRGLALAQEWQRQGGEAVFAGSIGPGPLKTRLDGEGFQVWEIPPPHPDPQDLAILSPRLREHRDRAGWIAVDGYHFAPEYHQALRSSGWPLLVIDDFRHLPAYDADILVNPNVDAEELSYCTGAQTLILRGARFALLRREFRQALPSADAASRHSRPADGCRILLTMGGADPDNVTAKVIDALAAMDRRDLDVTIIVGPLNPHRQALEEQVRTARFKATLMPPVADMVPLMRWADLAISAAGSTCWELAALGVPMVLTILADNQQRVAESLTAHEAAVSLGWHHAWEAKTAGAVLGSLVRDHDTLRTMSKRGRALIDGRGSERLTLALRGYRLSFRTAAADDCEMLFRWANDPLTRSGSFSPTPITWEEHCTWFAARLNDPAHIFYIASTEDGAPMGQARFSVDANGEGVISVSLAPEFRGAGLGPRLIRLACSLAMTERALPTVRALIKADNAPSLNAFTQAGFRHLGPVRAFGQPAMAMDYALNGAAA